MQFKPKVEKNMLPSAKDNAQNHGVTEVSRLYLN